MVVHLDKDLTFVSHCDTVEGRSSEIRGKAGTPDVADSPP